MPREKMPARRFAEHHDFVHADQVYHACIGRHDDGRIGELFLNAHKMDSAADAFAFDGAILISLLLQHGISITEIGHALKRDSGGRRASALGAAIDLLAGAA